MDDQTSAQRNERFLRRLMKRRPEYRSRYESYLNRPVAESNLESAVTSRAPSRDLVLETIVSEERPVLFVKDGRFDFQDVTTLGPEAFDLVGKLQGISSKLEPLLPLIGRIDVTNFPNVDFLGTGWFVDTNIVVTNRHVASLIAENNGREFVFRAGVGGNQIGCSFCNAHEYDDAPPPANRTFKVKKVLYIEPESGNTDIAFLEVERESTSNSPLRIEIASSDATEDQFVCVVGYPARASKRLIPNQDLMHRLFRDRFDVKRAAPGLSLGLSGADSEHDCSTLGGSSGSVVFNLEGKAVGLHFAGLYMQANYAVPASILSQYISQKRWNSPVVIESKKQPAIQKPGAKKPSPKPKPTLQSTTNTPVINTKTGNGSVTFSVPLTITVGLGDPVCTAASQMPPSKQTAESIEQAVGAYWDSRPEGVIAARVGFLEEEGQIGDQPCIAVSVLPDRVSDFEASGPHEFDGVPVQYAPADISEQLEAHPQLESVDSIAYDDDARSGRKFSFDPIEEEMSIILHVGPEYSWDVLKDFLKEASGEMVSAMYEFHASHIKEAIEARLDGSASWRMVLDNATFSKVRDPEMEFDRVSVFEEWADQFHFKRIVAPEGTSGLISDSYHIKVTVRPDDTFWLSSGNWKGESSQPVITQAQRDNAQEVDLPGNREWHVVIKNKTLADRFRNHILQDFKRSTDLGGREVPKRLLQETMVDVPIEEAIELERSPPDRIHKPKTIRRSVKVQPLLTPDQEGAVYSEAVLKLIRSARRSLLFQIPYIGMSPNPRDDRGYIDELIEALVKKLTTLDDARVILRTGSQKFSSPTHAAWYFKSKGVDIAEQLRVIENSHTKGMIVDGKRVLIGSHNWSKPGVTMNRDASLIFDDEEIATYYSKAFETDWNRSKPIRPRRFVRSESTILEAVGAVPPSGYKRIPLSELLTDD